MVKVPRSSRNGDDFTLKSDEIWTKIGWFSYKISHRDAFDTAWRGVVTKRLGECEILHLSMK